MEASGYATKAKASGHLPDFDLMRTIFEPQNNKIMATLTNEQIEQKKQLLEEKMKEMKAIYDELVEAGAIELSEDDLDQAAGGYSFHSIRLGLFGSI